jgi:hypothetical protein
VYADYVENCVFDNGTDWPIAGQMIQANPGGYIAYTDDNGDYSLVVPVGSYFVGRLPITNDPWTSQSCLDSYQADVQAEQTYPGNDFAVTWTGQPHCDVSVNIVSHGFHVGAPCVYGHDTMVTPCPGIEHEYLFVVKSEPTSTTPVPAGLEVDLGLNSVFTLGTVTSDFPITEVNIGPTNRLVYLEADLLPGQTCVIKVRGTPTGAGPYQAYASLNEPPCGGNHQFDTISETDQCSCDPNDLAVAPVGCGPNGNIVGDKPLTYTVRFENIGSGAAHNILIFDALDADLDLSSLKILQTSHPMGGYQIAFGNTLAMGFEGIDLPGIGDPANNKGYVVFSISPKPNLANGTTIVNTAEITFDFNEPVVTNTTLNTIHSNPCVSTDVTPGGTPLVHALGQNHPNPFNPATTIEYALAHSDHVTISVYNIKGALVQTLVNASQPAGQHSVEWNGRDQDGNPVASGVYLYRMHAGSFADTKKLVLLK